jgi:Family of unknown function (DUF6153)
MARMMSIVNGRYPSRSLRWAAPSLLVLMFVMAGLMLMHGVQASASPTDTRGVPLVSSSDTHQTTMHKGHPGGHSCHCNDHQHPGGQMCLALLVLGALAMFTVLLMRRRLARTTARRPATPGHGHPGRPPPGPSIFQLSVLRL